MVEYIKNYSDLGDIMTSVMVQTASLALIRSQGSDSVRNGCS